MALTLPLPSYFKAPMETIKSHKPHEELPGTMVCAPPRRLRRSSYRLRVKSLSYQHEAAVQQVDRTSEHLYRLQGRHSRGTTRVPVYVMLPLDTVSPTSSGLNRARALNASLMALRSAGVEGVMVDVWWGVVEKDGPLKYNWEGYSELVKMVANHGLKLQMVMSFHQCGGNVGDSCSIPLPPWVQEEMSRDKNIMYTDRSGKKNPEYISLGCDMLPVLRGRTPIQAYSDYMRSFRDHFQAYLGDVIVEIQVGMGPCGELRYPSYPESNGIWRFPGIGEFQCYDKFCYNESEISWSSGVQSFKGQGANDFLQYMKASLQASAVLIGHENWGTSGPHDSGHYNQFPEDTGFFKREGIWSTNYGNFFLEWYSGKLLEHGDRILAAAEGIFRGTGAKLSGKVAGIHWHYRTQSHAAELTAGYYNTRHRDGYIPIAQSLAKRGVVLNFTCMEMKDGQQPGHANCSPELLVQQVKAATKATGVELAGENALERYDESAFSQVLTTSRADAGSALSAFTYLRMNKRLYEEENWRQFVAFVKSMSEGRRKVALPKNDSSHSDLYVGFITNRDQKTAAAV